MVWELVTVDVAVEVGVVVCDVVLELVTVVVAEEVTVLVGEEVGVVKQWV